MTPAHIGGRGSDRGRDDLLAALGVGDVALA